MYISRNAESTIATLFRGFPIVVVTGPGQSGKSTLAGHVFSNRPYVTLEDEEVYNLAAAKVGGILANDTFPADFIHENLVIRNNVIPR